MADVALELVVLNPRGSFDAAVLARLLYAGLGAGGWRLVVVGRVPRGKVLVESRVPFRIGLERISFERSWAPSGGGWVLVDPDASKRLSSRPERLVVCASPPCPAGLEEGGVLGVGDPVYEAVAIVYAFYIRGSRPRCRLPARSPPPSLASTYVYVARKLLEAAEWVDNHLVLKPSVVAHTLNKAVSHWGVYVDLRGWRLEAGLYTREVIELEVYDNRLRRVGEARVVFDSSERLVRVEGVPLLDGAEFCLEPERGRVCLGPSEADCLGPRGEPSVSPEAFEALGL